MGGGAEEGAKHVDDFCSLEGGGLGEGAEEGDVVRAGRAAGSHADFAEDHERAQGAFGMVVGGRSTVFDEGEELRVFAGGWDEPLAEGFGLFEGQRLAADWGELCAELIGEFFARPCLFGNNDRARLFQKGAQRLGEPQTGKGVSPCTCSHSA